MKLRDYQEHAVQSIFDYFEEGKTGNPVVAMPTGCHAKGTEILMHDGSIKLVEDIIIGDLIMGPDSKPRKVLNLARGREDMVRVIPVKGEPFIVNKSHILHLYKTNERSLVSERCYNKTLPDTINIKLSDYLNKSNHFKHLHKLIRTEVDFKNKYNLEIWPWFLGLMIGDGCFKNTISITTMDEEIKVRIISYVEKSGCKLRISEKINNKASSYYITDPNSNRSTENRFTSVLRNLGLWNKTSENKFVPDCYKLNTRDVRLGVLAGILDADGHLCHCNTFDYITKSKRLAKDVVFIARSLGFSANYNQCIKGCQTGAAGIYFRCCISGDVSKIPCVLPRKQAEPRKQIKNVLVTGFKTELLSEDDFYGFALDKDHLYLTSDFTIHHNTGKSLVIAGFIQRVLSMWAGQRFMVMSHVKELLTQTHEKLNIMWPNAPIGIYSSGLNQKDIIQPIIFGGVASVVNVVEAFGHRDLVIIDEAHLVSPKDSTMYQNIIQRLKIINPYLKVIGLTATPYRLGQGMIIDDGLFTDICCDLTGVNAFNRLIAEGYICPLIPKRTNIEIDCSDLHISNGDYAKGELDDATDKVLYEALKELVEQGYDRQSWLIFASGIKSTEHSAEILQSFGIQAAAIHSKLHSTERDKRLAAFKRGELKAICGNNIFTTGFDHPPVDLIGMLRPTISPGLWVQMLGRGTRPFPDKRDCLVLDFAGNTRRLGPINDPVKPRKKGEKQGEAPIRICDACGVYNHASARHCCSCGMEFTFKTKLVASAGTDSLLRSDAPIIEHFNVDRVIYHRHEKEGASPSIKVSYYSGLRMFNEWVCLEHSGFVRKKARDWWRQRHAIEPPETTDEALRYVSELNVPKRIRVWINKKFPEVISCEW